LLKYEWN